MSAIDDLFAQLKSEGKKAFMPFITAGDPDIEFTSALLQSLDGAGCHLAELGIPYSDPIADGPVIQASYTRALNKKIKLESILDMATDVAPKLKMPIVSMVSYAIIYRQGMDNYLQKAIAAGISGAIVPDMPVDESAVFAEKCRASDFSLIQMITPTTERERAVEIAKQASGFIYYVSIAGITGERNELPPELIENLRWLKTQTDLPICVGFGISQPKHAIALKEVADGMIVGSAIVRRIAAIEEEGKDQQEVIDNVTSFAKEMLAAIND